jgi:hypothetical protein
VIKKNLNIKNIKNILSIFGTQHALAAFEIKNRKDNTLRGPLNIYGCNPWCKYSMYTIPTE